MADLPQYFEGLSSQEKMLIDTYLYKERCELVIAHHRLGSLASLPAFDVTRARFEAAHAFTAGELTFETPEDYVASVVPLQQMIDKKLTGEAKIMCDQVARDLTNLPELRFSQFLTHLEVQGAAEQESRRLFDALSTPQKMAIDMQILSTLAHSIHRRHDNGGTGEPAAWDMAKDVVALRGEFARGIGQWYRPGDNYRQFLDSVRQIQEGDTKSLSNAGKAEFAQLQAVLTFLPRPQSAQWVDTLTKPKDGRTGPG